MDLPDETPAGDLMTPVSAGEWSAARENSPAAPAGLAARVDSGSRSSRLIQKLLVPRSKRADGPVLYIADKTSPTAPGQKIMSKRTTLASAAAITGAGLLWLGLAACGQKPAPAEESAAAEATVATAPGTVQAMRVTRVEQRDLSDEVVATGRLVVREEAAVGSELAGYRVAAVYVDEGDWVKQGQPMAKLDDALLQAQIAQAEATLATQKANWDFKKNQLERAESLEKEGAFSKELLEQRRAESAGAEASWLAAQASVNEMKVRQSRMTLRAPVSGAVLQRSIRPGDISTPAAAAPYFRIARDGLIELDAELPDAKLGMVHEGTTATVTLTTGETLQGQVRFVSPRVDQNTSLGRARIALPYNKALRPGSFAEARFNSAASGAVVVQASAVRYQAGGPSVMLVSDDNRVKQVPVKLGERSGDYVQLVDGPPAGSRVLLVGASFTLDGDVITPLEGEAAEPAAAAPGGK